MHRTPPDIPG